MFGQITSQERQAWQRDGYFVRRGAFQPSELTPLHAAVERVAGRAALASEAEGESYRVDGNRYHDAASATIQFEHRPGSSTIRVIEPFHQLDSRLDRLIDDPRLVEPMRDLVGDERVSLFTEKINLKRPREGSGFRWHQDSPYWAHFCDHLDQLPNVMVALDEASERNGCFRVVPGSHSKGRLPGRQDLGELGPLFTDPRYFDESRQLAVEVPSGSLVFFSPHTVHGSQPNESDESRRALVITYQPGGQRMFKVDAVREAGTVSCRLAAG